MIHSVSLFLCDDQPIFRESIKTFISIQSNLEVCGQASNGQEALEAIIRLQPQICLIDLSMPYMDGASLIQELQKHELKTKIIVLSQHLSQDWLERLISNEIDGYILKSDGREFLLDAIWAVCSGDKYFSPSVASKFYQMLRAEKRQPLHSPLDYDLSPKEKEVAFYTSRGFTVKETAGAMNCSENTIKTHKSNLMRKIQAKNSAEITRWVLHSGHFRETK